MTVPDWVYDTVFYQIFPDRFANGNPSNDPPNVKPWGSTPTGHGFQGGDLEGIIQRLEYLTDLGVSGLYLNPIFAATSNHRYNTSDYYRIDPRLGELGDFHNLIQQAHQRGIRVILDGVFNHCGRSFFAFADVLENEGRSAYRDWFHIKRFPLEAYRPGKAEHYEGWWNLKELPKFNTDNPAVRRYLFDVAKHWIELGADGWRLDVPNEIDDDGFWAEFRTEVKSANSEAYLVGEIWEPDPRWVGPDHFDGLLNYPAREALLSFLLDEQPAAGQFADRLDGIQQGFPPEHIGACYSLLGSHDTARIATVLKGDVRKIALAMLFQFSYPGVPGIYYGDEIGLRGGEDPECRAAFPWDEAQWDQSLRSHVQQLVELRRRVPQLRRGDFKRLAVMEPGTLAFRRRMGGAEALAVVLNASPTRHSFEIPVADLGWGEDWQVQDQLSGSRAQVMHGLLRGEVAPLSGAIYLPH